VEKLKVLWQYTLIFLVLGMISSIMAFHRNITDVGSVFWLFVGAMSWLVSAWGLLTIHFKWGGSQNVVSYTYIPSWEGWILVFGLGGIGLLMLMIGIIRFPVVMVAQNPDVWGDNIDSDL